jgi:3-oxoacyl-[acyl-carrier protein] reductase
MGRLDGKAAIVTGAARGLGRAIALKLAEEEAKLLIVTRGNLQGLEETKKLVQAKGGQVISAKVDISSEKDTLEMADLAMKEFGRIDILVNNAAIGLFRKLFFEVSAEEWDGFMATNVRGPWQCIKAVFPQMKKQGKGKIVNIVSDAFFTGSRDYVHYVVTKGAIIGLTRAVARDVGDYGICINAVAPGFLANEAGLAYMGGDISKYDVKPQCIKRVGVSEDVIGAVVFLASDESDFISGQTIVIDGGRVMH